MIGRHGPVALSGLFILIVSASVCIAQNESAGDVSSRLEADTTLAGQDRLEAGTREEGTPAGGRRARIAASSSHLWAMQTAREGSKASTLLAVRSKFAPFEPARRIHGAVDMALARENDLYAWFEDGSLYRFFADGSPAVRENSLPGSARPLGWVAAERGIYAIVRSDVATRLAQPRAGQLRRQGETPTTEPAEAAFDAGDSGLGIAIYGNEGWQPLIACPPEVTAERSPALCVVGKGLFLFWGAGAEAGAAGEPQRIRVVRAPILAEGGCGPWSDFPSVPTGAPAFWPVAIDDRILALAGVESGADGESISTYQYIGDAWQSSALSFSALPETASEARLYHRQVVAFKQHLCALVETPGGTMFLRFAALEGRPTEKTEPLAAIFGQPAMTMPVPHQTILLFVLVVVFAMVWLFRRGSMITPIALPAGWRLALVSQRAAAWLLDVLPFAVAAALWRDVDISFAVGQLFAWAIAGGSENPLQQEPDVVIWWAVTASAYILYATLMELTAGRTVGKMVLRLHVMSEAGRPPLVWQALVRNALRIVELVPQLWVMQFLVVLTRNRQRLGDIFGRTLVVRADTAGTAPAKGKEDEERRAGGDDASKSGSEGGE